MEDYNEDLTVLVQCLAATFGTEVGSAVKDKFDQVLALGEVDINALQAQITALNALLAANTSGDTLTAQSILAQLAALDSRLDVLEGSTALADLQSAVTVIQNALTSETAAREAADAANAATIASAETAIAALAAQVATLEAAGPGTSGCDCVAINAAIAEQATALANLQASDAAQATQIAALQTAVQGLSVNTAAITAATEAAAAAQAAAAAAQATASAAQSAAQAAATAAAAAQAAADGAAGAAGAAGISIHTLKLEIKNINCAAVGASFRNAMRAQMFAPAN
jgi:hypothetical protein